MSDNDLLCKGIGRRWGTAYTQLIQWMLDPSAIARTHLIGLKHELKAFGDPPIHFLGDLAAYYASKKSGFSAGQASSIAEFDHLRRASSRFTSSNKRAMGLAQNVAQKFLIELIGGWTVDGDHFYPMARYYVEQVYVSRYEAPVLRYAELLRQETNERLNAIQPIIDAGMDHYADQITRYQSVEKLTLPRGLMPKKLSSVEDINNYLNEAIGLN